MSVSGISSSSLFDYNTQSVQNKMQQFQQEFQQLGQDLQSGNLSAAQSDFATLQQYAPQTNSTSSRRRAIIRLPRSLPSWAKICSRATPRRRSRTSPRFSRTFKSQSTQAAIIITAAVVEAAAPTRSAK